MPLQKRICKNCGKETKAHSRVKIMVNGKLHFICEECLDANREAMLADDNHPAWQYYDMVATALYGRLFRRGRTDD
jgi:hypothetical protein